MINDIADRFGTPFYVYDAAVIRAQIARVKDAFKAACQPSDVMTPPARMAAAHKRLDMMLDGVKSVRAALEDFYATLNDEQKAQFEAIGPRRTS